MAELVEATRLAISDFALVRQSRWREAIASIFDDPDFLPYLRSLRRIAVTYATHDETGAPGSTNLVKPIYHVGWLASRLGLSVVKPLAAGRRVRPVRRVRARPARRDASSRRSAAGSPRRCRTAGPRSRSSSGRSSSTMPAGTTLRVELLAERRGSELRADVTAEAETVHVRVWQDGVEALDRHFRAARRSDVDLLAEAIESGRRDPVAVGALRAAAAADRPGAEWHRERARDRRRGRPEARGRRGGRERIAAALAAAVGARGRADWATTGGSTRSRDLPAAGRARRSSTRSRGPTSTSGGATTGSCRATTRSRTSSRSTTSCSASPTPRKGTASGRHPAVPLPIDHLHPFPTGEAIGAGRGRGVVRRGARRRAARGRAPGAATAGRSSTSSSLGIGRRRPHPVGLPGLGGLRLDRARAGDPGADPHRAARRAGDAQPGGRRRRAPVIVVAHGDGEGPGHRRDPRPGTGSAPLAGPAGAARRGDLDPRRGRRRASCRAGDDRRRYTEASRFEGLPAVTIRPARESDGPAIGDVWLAAWRATFDFPPSHPDDDVRTLARHRAAGDARDVGGHRPDGRVVALMALTDDMIDQLYVTPDRIGTGIGSRLIGPPRRADPTASTSTASPSTPGRGRSTSATGSSSIATGDGSGNAERQPDIRYAWRPDR